MDPPAEKEFANQEMVESSDGDQTNSDADDAEAVEARIAVIQEEVESKRLQSEILKQDWHNAEEAKERYLRILQEFYDNM